MSSVVIAPEKFATAAPWDAVARVCRRICVLRSIDRYVEAEELHSTELMSLLSALRPNAEAETRVQAIFAAEEKRVADAQALAEVLAPLVAELLRAAPLSIPAPASAPAATPVSPAPTDSRPTRATAPSIADFIDDMIAQERPPSRALRRAS